MVHLVAGKFLILNAQEKFTKQIVFGVHILLYVFFSSFVLDRDTCSLHPTIEEYVDGARICLELESEKDSLREIKLYFCRFVMKMIKSFECKYTIFIRFIMFSLCKIKKIFILGITRYTCYFNFKYALKNMIAMQFKEFVEIMFIIYY